MTGKQLSEAIQKVFIEVWREQNQTEPPELKPETLLLETGLDSLGFAIIVTRLDAELGYDPFTMSDEVFYPQTFAEFAAFYERFGPAS